MSAPAAGPQRGAAELLPVREPDRRTAGLAGRNTAPSRHMSQGSTSTSRAPPPSCSMSCSTARSSWSSDWTASDVVSVDGRPAGRLCRGHAGVHQRLGGRVLRLQPSNRDPHPPVQAARRGLRLRAEDLVPDGGAPAGRAVPGDDQRRSPHGPTGEARSPSARSLPAWPTSSTTRRPPRCGPPKRSAVGSRKAARPWSSWPPSSARTSSTSCSTC